MALMSSDRIASLVLDVMAEPSHDLTDTLPADADESVVMRSVSHWSVFLPAVFVCALYGGVWLWMLSQDRGDGAIARLMLLVCVVIVPLLLVHAFLRYMSTCVTVTKSAVILERGWPRRMPITVVFGDVSEIGTSRPVFGRLFGSGALILSTRRNKRFVVGDLEDPEGLAETLRRFAQ